MTIDPLQDLIKMIAKLPGLGSKSATRIALHFIKDPASNMVSFAKKMHEVAQQITTCQQCFNIDLSSPCKICCDQRREQDILCVLESVNELWAIEKSNSFNGQYHILGGTLSAIDGITPDDLTFKELKERIINSSITEVIIATNPTLDGQTTAHYVEDLVRKCRGDIKISKLAHGIPIGAELDYIDQGTLAVAFNRRSSE